MAYQETIEQIKQGCKETDIAIALSSEAMQGKIMMNPEGEYLLFISNDSFQGIMQVVDPGMLQAMKKL